MQPLDAPESQIEKLVKIKPFSSGLGIKNKFFHFAIMAWGEFVVSPRWPHVLITKLLQPSHNYVI